MGSRRIPGTSSRWEIADNAYVFLAEPMSGSRVSVMLLEVRGEKVCPFTATGHGEWRGPRGRELFFGIEVDHATHGLWGRRVRREIQGEIAESARRALLAWRKRPEVRSDLRKAERRSRRVELASAEGRVRELTEQLAAARVRLAAAKKAVRRG